MLIKPRNMGGWRLGVAITILLGITGHDSRAVQDVTGITGHDSRAVQDVTGITGHDSGAVQDVTGASHIMIGGQFRL